MASLIAKSQARIRSVQSGDEGIVRDVSIQRLRDSPRAFRETPADAQARSPAEWSALVERFSRRKGMAAFLAEDFSGVSGFVRGDPTEPRLPPGAVLAGQLGVSPQHRGRGLGRELMNSMVAWAEERKQNRIYLGLTESNLRVQKSYESLGYADTAICVPLPWDSRQQNVVMEKRLTERSST